MEEIEVKILEVDLDQVRQKLKGLGAKKVFDGEVTASFLDFNDGRLADAHTILRLRRKDKAVELTLKEEVSKKEAKIMKEYEVQVDDLDMMRIILEKLGLRECKTAGKHRESYLLDEIHFELDTFPDIPTFLEIEAPTLEKVREYVERLGFSMDDTKPWSREDVLRHYGKL